MGIQEEVIQPEQKESGLYIREVVLDNLKSFRGKTRIELDRGFTAISGPNGSGKSNIIDALGFACGIQSSRELRADNLTDLIHKDGDVDYAEVEVVFEREDGERFTVKRRVKKTKNDYYSYFYIDGKSCNLSDVRDLLFEEGMSMEGHNVVMQGDVTRITETTPLRRREILDEVAGVAEFDSRIDRAESELDVVKEKIERVGIVLEEVRTRLLSLEDERDDALRYQELRGELGDLEKMKELSRYGELEAEAGDIESALEERRSEKDGLVEELATLKEELAGARENLEGLNEEVSQKGETNLIELRRDTESIRGKISRRRDEIELLEEKISDSQKESRRLFSRKENLEERAERCSGEVEQKELAMDALDEEIREKEGEIGEVEERLEALDDEFVELKEEASELRGQISDLRDEKSELIREQDRLLHSLRRNEDDRARVGREVESIEEALEQSEEELTEITSGIRELEERRDELQEDGYELERRKRYLEEQLESVEDELREAQSQLARSNATVRAAEELEKKYARPVRRVLEAGRSGKLPGILGTVAELGKVSEEYSTALETAAGGRMQNVVVATDSDGERAINFLKERGAGRCTFLPLNKIRGRPVRGSARDALKDDGVLDLAINLVEFDDRYDKVFSHIFGDTLVVEDMKTARRLMGGLRMVTLDGSLVESSGAMTGGSRKTGFKFTQDEEEKLSKLSERVTELEGEREKVLGNLESVESEEKEHSSELKEVEKALDSARRDLAELEARTDRKEKEREERLQELQDLEEGREVDRERLEEIETDIGDVEERISGVREDLMEVERRMEKSEAPRLLEMMDSLRGEKTDLLERKRELKGSVDQKSLEVELIDEELEEVGKRREELAERRSGFESSVEEKGEDIERLEEELEKNVERERQLEEELGDLRVERDAALDRVNDLEDRERNVTSKIEHVEERIGELEARLEEKEGSLEALREVVERWDVDPDDAPSPRELEERRKEIEGEMERLEPVNMRAVDEYGSVERREASLTDKHATLVEEREAILERMEELEGEKRHVFMDAFESIDEKFGEIFSLLSPGGSAELVLEDEEDPFAGGLEVKAMPGGKDVHSLDAMSGGEKSLTALSILFAIQRHDPAPFYAFDEIDMFLDGANAERVGRMIETLSEEAQFIVVSLRQPTLERSDRIVGVTMGDGASRVTGVTLAA